MCLCILASSFLNTTPRKEKVVMPQRPKKRAAAKRGPTKKKASSKDWNSQMREDAKKTGKSTEAKVVLDTVQNLVHQALELREKKAKLEAELLEVSRDIVRVERAELPELMLDNGMSSLTLEDGTKVAAFEDFSFSVTEANRDKVNEWLEKGGHGDLIKGEVTVTLPRGDDKFRASLLKTLDKKEVEYKTKRAVHNSTMKAFLKSAREDGERLPNKLLKVSEFKNSRIKLG